MVLLTQYCKFMRATKIGFGYTKNEGNYENSKVWLEAELEDWESASESLNILRSQVAEELKLPREWHDLRGKISRQEETLKSYELKIQEAEKRLEQAQRAWDNFSEFLTAHRVNPKTLTIENFSAMRELHTDTLEQANSIVYASEGKEDNSCDSYSADPSECYDEFDPYPPKFYDD